MSIGRIMTLAEKLSAEDQALVAGFILAMSSRGNVQPSTVSNEPLKPVSKTTAWRMKKAAESVSTGSTSVPNAFQNVPSGTAETFHGTGNETGGTFHGTSNAPASALSLSSYSEKTAEKESTGARASERGTASGTIGGTIGGTNGGTFHGTAGGTLMAKAEAVRVALTDGFKSRGIIVPARSLSVPHSREVIDIARSVEPSDLPKLIEGFFADPDAMKKGYPPAWLATNPAQYMPKPSAATASTVGRPSNLTDHEHHALNREEAVAKGERVKGPDPMHLASAKAKIAAAQQARAS